MAFTKVRPVEDNPTKRSKVYKQDLGPVEAGTTAPTDADYLFNTSTYDEAFEGTTARVIDDIQNAKADVAKNDWLRKSVQREVDDAVGNKRPQVRIPLYKEDRSAGVNEWYQSAVAPTLANIAKANNMDYEVQNIDGVDTAIANVREDTAPPAFASDFEAASAGYDAIAAGYSQAEVATFLNSQGYEGDDLSKVLNTVDMIAQLKNAGYDDDTIVTYYTNQETRIASVDENPTSDWNQDQWEEDVPEQASLSYKEMMSGKASAPRDLLTNLQVLYPDMSTVTTNIAGFFGDQEAQRLSEEGVINSRNKITQAMGELGYDVEYNEDAQSWVYNTPNGTIDVTPSLFDELRAESMELAGSIGLGAAGIKAGRAAAAKAPGASKLIVGPAVALGAAALGAAGGSQIDYMEAAIQTQLDLEGEVMARKALNASELAVFGGILGAGAVKVIGKSWSGVKRAVDSARGNLIDPSAKALEEVLNVSPEQAKELATKLARITNPAEVPTKQAAKELAAAALTVPGGEELVKAATKTSPKAGRAVISAIDQRAKDVLAATNKLSGDDVGRWVREDLEGYKQLVKDGYQRVKVAAASSPRSTAFTFNFNELALQPVLETLQKNIQNPQLAFKFAAQAQRIRGMSTSRRLPDLIELRKLVNEFKFNKNISRPEDIKILDAIKDKVDKGIVEGARVTMDNPAKWLKDWKASNVAYSEMKKLEKNALMKILTRPGVSEDVISKTLVRYAPALDDTFTSVLTKLPKSTRIKTEGKVINALAEKFAKGEVDGIRAMNFPALAQELQQVNFTTPQAKVMKQSIARLADVFKNDVPLSRSTGGIQVEKFAQALTSDMKAKVEYALATKIFRRAQTLLPTESGKYARLLESTAKVLEDPLNSKSLDRLRLEIDGENLLKEIENVVQQTVLRRSAGNELTRVKLYGDGKVLVPKGAGKEHSVPLHRIANSDDMKSIADSAGISITDRKSLDIALKEKGYMAARLGADKVRLIE